MNSSCCPSTRVGMRKRFVSLAGWALPTAALALLPKCPVCLAAYIALGTGIGISVTAATWLRTSVLVLSITLLTFLGVRLLRSRLSDRSKASPAV